MKIKHVITTLALAGMLGAGAFAGIKASGDAKEVKAGVATETTVYCAISSATLGTYTLKLNTNQQTNPDSWQQYTMTSAGTYGDLLLYSCTYTDLWGGVAAMQFQLYDGSTWKEEKKAISSWQDVASYNGKTYLYDSASWDVDKHDVNLQVTFTSDVPDYADIYIPGEFNGWSTDVSKSKMTRVNNTTFQYALDDVAEGSYKYLVVACYAGASVVDYNHKVDASDQTISISADGLVSLGSRTYDFAGKMPQKKAPEGAQVQLTFASQVPNSVDIIYVGGLTNWGNTKADMDAGKMTGNAGRTVFTWDIPENTYIGDYSYKIVAMSKYTKVTAVAYADIVYGASDHDETLTIDETTLTYPLTANDHDLSDLGAFAFAEGFVDATKDICADEDADNKAGLQAIWATWKSNFEGLTEGAKSIFGSSESETIVQARSLYLHCVARYGLAAWTGAPTSSNAVITINSNKVAANNAWIIVVISSITIVSLLGASLMIKRRKEDR